MIPGNEASSNLPDDISLASLPDDVKVRDPWLNLQIDPLSVDRLNPLNVSQPIRHNDTLEGDSILQMEMNRLSKQVELLQEQVARLQEQQFVSLDGERGTLEQLADKVAEKLKKRANLW